MVLVRKGSSTKRKSGTSSVASSTLSADANARQVTRAEFMELAAAGICASPSSGVENQLASDLEFASAQVAANKTAMGTLAELVIEKTSGIEQQGATQLQGLQVESEQRLTDVKLALERLEFRLRHHTRDCQALTEQVERHQELLQGMRTQLGQTQLLVEKQQEHAKTFTETVEYTVSASEAKMADAATECAQKLEAFQQRMVGCVKKLNGDTQEPLKDLSRQLRDVEIKGKRQTALFQQALDDLVEMRQALHELQSLKALVEREQEFHEHTRKEDAQRLQSVERKISKVISLVEKGAEKAEVQRLVSRLETNVKSRVEAVLEFDAPTTLDDVAAWSGPCCCSERVVTKSFRHQPRRGGATSKRRTRLHARRGKKALARCDGANGWTSEPAGESSPTDTVFTGLSCGWNMSTADSVRITPQPEVAQNNGFAQNIFEIPSTHANSSAAGLYGRIERTRQLQHEATLDSRDLLAPSTSSAKFTKRRLASQKLWSAFRRGGRRRPTPRDLSNHTTCT
ncbi:hypothetical protein ON010_g12098 [Phytophthora cinnamomi]|nr:hypothetical protein ON010_g12098 [Phytophthora cinnamomi]